MYNVSEAYLEKINSVSKQVYWYGTVRLTNGTVYNFDVSNLSQGQTKISKELCNANAIRLGGTCSSELKISFMLDYDGQYYTLNGLIVDRNEFYNGEITLTFRLLLDNGYEDVELGTFIVADTERKQMILTCTAYDYMQKFNKKCVSTIQGLPYNVLLSACSICGVELGSQVLDLANMVNGSQTIAMYDPKNQITTWRDVIGYVASMLCANAIIKADKKLYIIPFKKGGVRTIGAGDRVSLTLEDYVNNFQTITATNLRASVEDKVSLSDDGLVYPMGANPLMQYVKLKERKAALRAIIKSLSKLVYTPFDGTFFCDPSFELGDVVLFTENHAYDNTMAVITKIEISISGHMSMGCVGENPNSVEAMTAASPTTSEATSGSTGDGVIFYDFVDNDDLEVTDEEQFALISYESNGYYRQEFASELEIEVDTNSECLIEIIYKINSVEVANCHPKASYTSGKHLLHLLYFWEIGLHIETSTLEANIKVTGGTVTIKNNYSRIMQSGVAFPEVSNELSYIDVQYEPHPNTYWLNQPLVYNGLKVVAEYEDGHVVDITSQCTLNPAEGTIATNLNYTNVDVTYMDGEKPLHTAFAMEEITPEELKIVDPIKTKYYSGRGDRLDYNGLIVKARFSDGTEIDVTDQCEISPADNTLVTSETPSYVKVKYTYYTHSPLNDGFDLDIEPYQPETLSITPPTKVSYTAGTGETLDYTGLVVLCTYTDGSEHDVTSSCVKIPAEGTEVTANTPDYVKIEFTDCGVKLTDDFDLNILTVDEIKVHAPELSYEKGETLDFSGVTVDRIWSDGTTDDITSQCTFSPASGTAASTEATTITVSYTFSGKTFEDTFDIEVYEFTGIAVTTEPTKTSYWLGEPTDYSGIVVSGEYSNDTTEDVTSGCTFNPADNTVLTSLERTTVYVSYVRPKDGKTYSDSFSIEVSEPDPMLKYLNYTVDDINRVIHVYGLNVAEIETDGLRDLIIPATFTDEESGITYTLVIH